MLAAMVVEKLCIAWTGRCVEVMRVLNNMAMSILTSSPLPIQIGHKKKVKLTKAPLATILYKSNSATTLVNMARLIVVFIPPKALPVGTSVLAGLEGGPS
jgi:hypothetical protein